MPTKVYLLFRARNKENAEAIVRRNILGTVTILEILALSGGCSPISTADEGRALTGVNPFTDIACPILKLIAIWRSTANPLWSRELIVETGTDHFVSG